MRDQWKTGPWSCCESFERITTLVWSAFVDKGRFEFLSNQKSVDDNRVIILWICCTNRPLRVQIFLLFFFRVRGALGGLTGDLLAPRVGTHNPDWTQDVELPTSALIRPEGGSGRREARVDESVSFHPWPILINHINCCFFHNTCVCRQTLKEFSQITSYCTMLRCFFGAFFCRGISQGRSQRPAPHAATDLTWHHNELCGFFFFP